MLNQQMQSLFLLEQSQLASRNAVPTLPQCQLHLEDIIKLVFCHDTSEQTVVESFHNMTKQDSLYPYLSCTFQEGLLP